MIKLAQAVIVEGKYDKIKLSSIVDAVIIQTDGFSVFKDKEKLALIRFYAENTGIIILTDSDTAGFRIRSYLKGCVSKGNVTNVYIPDIFGKEKRKAVPSKEGKLGVEGIDADIILDAFTRAGIICSDIEGGSDPITRTDLYEDGLSGGKDSSYKRKALLSRLNLPLLLTTGSMLEVLNTMMTREQYRELIMSLSNTDGTQIN